MPDWVYNCCTEYFQRMPAEFKVTLIEVPIEKRRKNQSINVLKSKDTQRLLEAVPKNDWIVALDEKGQSKTTAKFAQGLEAWCAHSRNVTFLIGGPDGIDFSVQQNGRNSWPDQRWSLSELTFPHPLARVILAEQIYRAWSVLAGHPYHRV